MSQDRQKLSSGTLVSNKRYRRGSGRTTLADVAKVAGVSAQTVSRVLNNPQAVPPPTVLHVRAAIEQLRYVPNRIAGSLASGRSKLVAALVPAIASPVFLQTLEALTQVLARSGYQLMLGESGYDDADEVQLLENIISRGPDGIVLTRVVQSELARQRLSNSGIPVVETWDLTDRPVDMLVGFSHERAGEAVADLLISRGVRRPALITGNDPRARRRRDGYARRLVARGMLRDIDELPVAEVSTPAPMGHGRRALQALLARGVDFDGVFCSTDMLALGALIEARDRNIRVPERLAVVGFGDLVVAADTSPALTTVRIDGYKMGTLAGQCIIDRASGVQIVDKTVDIGFELVIRDSA